MKTPTVLSTCLVAVVLLVIVGSTLSDSPDDRGENQTATSTDRRKSGDRASNEGAESRSEFESAGVCARCHVVSVLEWGISGHAEVETNCQECHGASRGHVANERNEVKPDRLPRGDAVARQLCLTCHDAGCPDTMEVQSCQKCHHMHALINPDKPPTDRDENTEQLLQRWAGFKDEMDRGTRCVEHQRWKSAQAAFEAALALIPGDHFARTQLMMCRRRLDPALPGFQITDKLFDSDTGLPQSVTVDTVGIPMRLVPPGQFDMGSDGWDDSRPVHSVHVDAFFLGTFEVTQAEWVAVMGKNPSVHQGADFPHALRMPAEQISWEDCQGFIRRLNDRVPGGGFRLPTEAEWEYACGSDGQDLFRVDHVTEFAWCRANARRSSDSDSRFTEIDGYAPRAVGTLRPNHWGFYDMQGNVSEWCSSLWRPYLYDRADGRESLTENGLRVVRGGSYSDAPADLNPAFRHSERSHRRFRFHGLRLARDVPQLPAKKDK